MKRKIRRMIGLVLAVILCFCMLSTTVFAVEYYGGTISSDVAESHDTIRLNADTTIAEGVTFALTSAAHQYINISSYVLTNYGTITKTNSDTNLDGGTFYNYGVCEITVFYDVTIYDLTLSSIVLSAGTLSPSFAAGTRDYAVTVDNSVTSIDITPTLNTGTGVKSMTVNGTTAASGAASTVSLSVGENSIPIVITASDGSDTANTYTLTVTRASATDYTITNALFVSAGTLGISQDMLQWSNVDAPGGYKLEIYTESGTQVYTGTLTNNYTPASEVLTSSGTYYYTVYALDSNGNELSSKTSDKFTYTHTHSLTLVEANGATCTEAGNDPYWICSVCGGYFNDSEASETLSLSEVTIAATGHDWGANLYSWSSDWQTCTVTRTCQNDSSHIEVEYATVTSEVTKAATCTEYGEVTYTGSFSVDWATQQQRMGIISATGHSYEAVVTEPTCTTGGYTTYICSVCGESYTADETEATGHSLTYTASENTITESCANGCGHSATATLAGPGNLAYDGSSKAASVSYGTDWKGDTPTVEYLDSSSTAVDADSVVNAGTYTAQITVGGATASVSFTITAAQLSAPGNLQWSGTTTTVTASWDEVTNAGSYMVQLYKDGTAEGNAVSVTETSTTFTITEAGSYTFTVTAVGTDNYSSSAESEASTALNFYTVTWKNDDNTLKTDMVQSGVTLSYSGDEPTKDTDGTYIYTFSGWSPTVGAITNDTIYTAVYSLTYVAPSTGEGYAIDYSAETVAAESGYEISTDGSTWSSTLTVTPDGTLYVRRAADTAASASTETTNTLASRPGAPSVTAVDEVWYGESDGQITGVTTAMEYSADGSTWTACTGTTIDSLAAGTYYVRYKATDSAFASMATSVTIASGQTRTYTLTVTAPTFAAVTYGYTQPEAASITITSSGNSDATITSVTVSSVSFTIAGSGSTVTAQGTNTSYTIRPVAGLNTGTYTATIIVAYDGGATAEAEVSFTVNKAAQSLSYSGDSVIKHINDEAFINELTRTTVDGAISYASDNTDAAIVDENGKVTITGAGTAVITATAAETDNYNKTTASYTLTVTDHSYTATVVAPTYTEQGYTLHICEDCGDSYKTDYTAIRVIDGTDEDLTTKTTVQELTAVPEGLNNLYSSVDELISDLTSRVIAAGTGYTADNAIVYDVVLQYSLDNGDTWEDATADNFPAAGITVTLPYPDGTDSGYEFSALHMFTVTSSRLGITAGGTETPTITKTDDGLVVTLMGLSPVAVSWKEVNTSTTETETTDTSTQTDDTSDSANTSGTTETETADTATQTDNTTDNTDTSGTSASGTTSVQMGDNSRLVLWLVLLLISGAGVVGIAVYYTKRKHSR